MSGKTAVQLNGVTKRISGKTIVDQLTFDINSGEIFGLLGPNGAGKTTTIRMLVGLISITEGEVFIQGKSISSDFKSAIRHVGGIVENPELYPFLTGYQNLVHFANMSAGISKERIQEVATLVNLDKRLKDKVKTYSLGMRQRLGIAQALLHKPSVLILDEPTNGLDPAGIRELRDYLRRLSQEENVAVIVSSHLLTEMELMCDRVAVINQGKLIEVKDLKEFIRGNNEDVPTFFEVDDLIKAKDIITKVFSDIPLLETRDGLEVKTSKKNVALINSELNRNGIQVYGIYTPKKSLEDKFLEITREDNHVKTNS
ncbi:ABC transporter ATP-binding protein [Desulfosporosinus sp.]|uniref:ABC transporter ATP-binding protein n=1 Tax=Desulfosporosinus sp. TaxID=157907 RepID=UPI0025BC46B3|nr:ABC transporter ATP-binding protein [Desulfosporosinus sp.]MBC2725506.1 ABC transporter ATP-binding protein [Desulfosporosinus sp.]